MQCRHCGREIVRINFGLRDDDWVDKKILEFELKKSYIKRPISTSRNIMCTTFMRHGYHEPYLFTEYYKQLNLCI